MRASCFVCRRSPLGSHDDSRISAILVTVDHAIDCYGFVVGTLYARGCDHVRLRLDGSLSGCGRRLGRERHDESSIGGHGENHTEESLSTGSRDVLTTKDVETKIVA